MKGEFLLSCDDTEIEIVESCLNLASSGRDSLLKISLYAFLKGWHINKLIYYVEMIKEIR